MTEQELNEYSIFGLREMARRMGVKSPTSQRKAVLINQILEIEQGIRTPNVSKRQGRPPKNHGYSFDTFNSDLFSTNVTLKQDSAKFDYGDATTVTGYIEKTEDNTSFLWDIKGNQHNICLIPTVLLNKYNIKTGDLVTGELSTINNKTIVKDVYNVNSCPIKKFKTDRADYLEIKPQIPEKNIEFNKVFEGVNIQFGENVYLYGQNNNENTQTIINMLNSCNATKKIYINVTVAEKNKIYLDQINKTELFVANITENKEIARRIVNIATERAKRLFENGEDVVIAVDDVLSVASTDDENISNTKNVMSISKDGKQSGTISLFAILSNNKTNDIFEKLADKRFKIVDKKLFLI